MNPLLEEYLVEEHQRDIERKLNDIQLQGQAVKVRAYRPTLSTRVMRGFGQWLIERGEGLVKRYETPSKKRQPSNRRYAH